MFPLNSGCVRSRGSPSTKDVKLLLVQISRSIINIITKLQHFYCQFLFSPTKSLSFLGQASHLAVRPVPQNVGWGHHSRRAAGRRKWGVGSSREFVFCHSPTLSSTALAWSFLLPAGPMARLTQADGLELSLRQKRFLRVLHCGFRYV